MKYSIDSEIGGFLIVSNEEGYKGVVYGDGEIVIVPIRYEAVKYAEYGFFVKSNNKYGFYSFGGRHILPDKYDDIKIAKYSLVVNISGKIGIYSGLGKCLVPAYYRNIEGVEKGYIVTNTKNLKGFYLDDGTKVLESKYENIIKTDENKLQLFCKNSKHPVIYSIDEQKVISN